MGSTLHYGSDGLKENVQLGVRRGGGSESISLDYRWGGGGGEGLTPPFLVTLSGPLDVLKGLDRFGGISWYRRRAA